LFNYLLHLMGINYSKVFLNSQFGYSQFDLIKARKSRKLKVALSFDF